MGHRIAPGPLLVGSIVATERSDDDGVRSDFGGALLHAVCGFAARLEVGNDHERTGRRGPKKFDRLWIARRITFRCVITVRHVLGAGTQVRAEREEDDADERIQNRRGRCRVADELRGRWRRWEQWGYAAYVPGLASRILRNAMSTDDLKRRAS